MATNNALRLQAEVEAEEQEAAENRPLETPAARAGTEHIIQVGGAVILKPRRFRNVPPPLGLNVLEMAYFRDLRGLLVQQQAIITRELSKSLAKALGQAEVRLTFDTGITELERTFQDSRAIFLMERSDENIDAVVRSHGLAINSRNRENFRRTFKQVMGVDVFAAEPWLEDEVSAFMMENSSFIKSIGTEHLADVEQMVFRNVKAGNGPGIIAKEMRDIFSLSENRSRLIARDQTGKFHSRLTRLRYEGVGLKRYRWRTLADSRVRDDHEDLEGTIHEFSDPPVTVKKGARAGQRNNPGEDIQCRCWAEPLFEDLLAA